MTRRQQWILLAGIVAASATGLIAFSMLQRDEYSLINAGTAAPDFTAQTLDATPVRRTLADYRGQVVLINIWKTDCAPCVEEMATLEMLHREFHGRGLRVVAVSVDVLPDAERLIREFVKKYDLTFEVLFDPDRDIESVYRTRGVPESYVIGRDGIVTRKHWGWDDWSSLPNRALIAQLVGAGQPPDTTEPPLPAQALPIGRKVGG